jgi:hypothetical protein
MGEELNHTTARTPGPLWFIQYSLLRFVQVCSQMLGGGGGDLPIFFAFPPAEKCPYDDIGQHAACRTQLHKGHSAGYKNSQDDRILFVVIGIGSAPYPSVGYLTIMTIML